MTVTFNPVTTNSGGTVTLPKTSQEYRMNKYESFSERIAATKQVVSTFDIPRGAAGRPNLYTHLITEALAVTKADRSKAWAVGPFTEAECKSITQGLRSGIKKLNAREDLRLLQRKVLGEGDALMIYLVAKNA